MSNAKQRALEAYPIAMSEYSDNCKEYDSNESDRLTFIEGYHQAEKDLHKSIYKAGVLDGFEDAVEGQYEKGYEQAEKDLELTWKDIKDILNIYEEVIDMDSCKDIYGEVLKRFRDYKEKRK